MAMQMMPPPASSPPGLKRKPFDISALPPELQRQLAAEGSLQMDGAVIYADGTATGPGDSPDDFAGAMTGGWENAPQFSGPPTAAPEVEPNNPLGGPLFKRFRQTSNAPFPGTPGGVGGGPVSEEPNPMGDPLPNPFEPATEAKSPMSNVPELPPTASPPAFATKGTEEKSGGYQGRVGRRMQSRQQTRPGSRPMGNRRRR